MKIKTMMIAVLAAAIGMASCAKEDTGIKNQSGSAAELSIKFQKTTRAFDDKSTIENGIELEDAVIFVFDALGAKVSSKFVNDFTLPTVFDHENDGIRTSNVSRVVVIGNTANAGNLTDKASVESLRAVIKDLEDVETELRDNNNIWVYGEETNFTWGAKDDDGVQTAKVDIKMHPIMTRIDVTVDIDGITGGIDGDTPAVTFEGVTLLYSAAKTTFIKPFTPSLAELGTAKPMYSGLIDEFYDPWTQSQNVVQYKDVDDQTVLFADWAIVDNKFTKTFYALAPDFDLYGRNSILTVFGTHRTYNEDESVKKATGLFWPLHFSEDESADGAAPLESGTYYQVEFKFKGDFSNGGGGNDKPEPPANNGKVEITIKKPQWIVGPSIITEFGPSNP